MKKLLLIVSAILLSTVNLIAQEYTIYYENFDANNGGWASSTGSGRNGSWSHTSSSTPLTAEAGYWHLTPYNNYSSNSQTYLTNPSAISTLGFTNVTIYFDIRYDTSDDVDDGMQIQYTLDPTGTAGWTRLGSNGSGNRWYNDTDVDGIANLEHGWTGINPENATSNSKFLEASLPSTVLNNQASLRFRVLFASDIDVTTDDGVAIDNVIIKGDYLVSPSDPTYGPAGVNTDLRLWLKANTGTSTTTDNTAITTWSDQAFDNDAIAYSSFSPLYKNNATDNLNFNPVIDFDRSSSDHMKGKGGYHSQDYFVVLKPNEPIDNTGLYRQQIIAGKFVDFGFSVDGTGIGFGFISSRYTDAVIAHTISSYPQTGPPNATSYGRCFSSTTTTIDEDIMILNIKTDATDTVTEIYLNGVQIDNQTGLSGDGTPLNFNEVDNLIYYLGVGRFTMNGYNPAVNSYFDGRIAEVISYKSKNSTTDQQKIYSYLALKYGLTYLSSTNTVGTTQTDIDYLDSSGNVIWDISVNSGYNYQVAGIGRDDASELNQKQSKSVHETSDGTGLLTGILTMGLTEIYDTNSNNIASNPTNFGDQEFLVWGNDGTSITALPFSVLVDMSAGIGDATLTTDVTFDGMQPIWKVVETGGDIPSVQVSIPKNAVRNISPPGSYLMFISDTNVFDPTADYRVMTEDAFGNLKTDYNFNATKYITFGYAEQVIVERSVYFDGVQDYIDVENHLDLNTTEFTISSWIKRDIGTTNASILSKRDYNNIEGYDLRIDSSGNLAFTVNGAATTLTSLVAIPENEWHQVAVIYEEDIPTVSGTATLYIDGVADTSAVLPAPAPTSQKFLIAAVDGYDPNTTDYFAGNIDEVRIWDVALTPVQLRYIMNQEIIDSSVLPTPTLIQGNIIPTTITKNEISSIPWTDLAGYYPMSVYTYTNTNDMSGNNYQGALRNLDTVDWQTAPLPYESENNGAWTTNATWLNNAVQTLPNDLSIVDGTTPIDWNIVETNHDITIDTDAVLLRERSVLGLIVNSNEITINGVTSSGTGNGLTVTHYLELNGSIDLNGESQLIQTDDSVLVVGGSGDLERDQQGTADTFTYNYWSSPVGVNNTTSTNDTYESIYTVPTVLRDGSNPAIPAGITFLTSGYNGSSSPFSIADYWIWKFANLADGDYSLWQHMRSTGNILPGEGFTMKGPGTGTISTPQNYVFNGKPNNGDITFTINGGNDYLVGNPYPSALNAHEFLSDNTHTNGTLYFWEHWGGGSHNLGDYQGGYALLNFSGATPTPTAAVSDADVNQTGSGTKLPGQYIPVSQGFFVYSAGGGTMKFENDQRVFQKEGATSTFMRTESASTSQPIDYNEDGRMKFRIGLNSFNGIHRQILLTVDENATSSVDWGYDGKLNGNQIDDMYWMIEEGKYGIQGLNIVTEETVAPLGIHVRDNGTNFITIDHLENVTNDIEIYARDNVLDIYHNLRQSDYEVYLTAGEYLDRFAIVFTNPNATALSDDDFELNNAFEIFYNNDSKSLVLLNPDLVNLDSLELFNIIGQSVYSSNEIETESNKEIKVSNLSAGTYIINLNTESGKISKKVLVK